MKPGEVYWVEYRDAAGRVQGGRRPAIVLQDDLAFPARSPMVLTVPLTSQLAASRFPGTLLIDPTSKNGLESSEEMSYREKWKEVRARAPARVERFPSLALGL
jgi:mRNA-degrading endonuclease toxin of MazEF toxin-antitoxin module